MAEQAAVLPALLRHAALERIFHAVYAGLPSATLAAAAPVAVPAPQLVAPTSRKAPHATTRLHRPRHPTAVGSAAVVTETTHEKDKHALPVNTASRRRSAKVAASKNVEAQPDTTPSTSSASCDTFNDHRRVAVAPLSAADVFHTLATPAHLAAAVAGELSAKATPSPSTTSPHDDTNPAANDSAPWNDSVPAEAAVAGVLATLARDVLQHHALAVAGRLWRLLEVEAYLLAPDAHADPFTHATPAQAAAGVWYFHRQGKSFRNGTYKGLDLSLGGGLGPEHTHVHGGLLLRAMESCDGGERVEGPCNLVEAILKANGADTINALLAAHFTCETPSADGAHDRQSNVTSALRLVCLPTCSTCRPVVAVSGLPPAKRARLTDFDMVYAGPRVGLSLKRATADTTHHRFFTAPYRFFRIPRSVSKGRQSLILGLAVVHGLSPAQIADLTGARQRVIEDYLAAYTKGAGKRPVVYYGRSLAALELCAAMGSCSVPLAASS